jgi:mRNA interferase RelE/StbE
VSGDAPFRVAFAPRAARELERLPALEVARLRRPVLSLAFDRYPAGVARLTGTDLWRIRVGDARVIYRIDETTREVLIVRVARRSERTYRGL